MGHRSQPTWPYAWYGMGLAEYGVGDSQISFVTGLKTMLGKDALTRSAMAFAKSAEVDPSFVRGLVELSNTALRQRVNIKLGVALDALRRSAATPAAEDPEVLLARGRVEREVGDGDSALVAFRGYLDRGASRSLAQLEIARTLFLLGRFDGVQPYYEGAASGDPATVAGYRNDLATIASTACSASSIVAGAKRVAYLRRFWTDRDREELRADGERLREHYRRLFYARKNFQLTSLNRHYDIVERYRSGSRDFDDRGVIYIRHGEPSSASYLRRARPRAQRVVALHPARRRSHLPLRGARGRAGLQAGREPVRRARLQPGDRLARRPGGDNPVAEQLMLSREELSPIYQRLQSAGSSAAGSTSRRSADGAGEHRARYQDRQLRAPLPRDLKVRSDVLAVGHDSSGTLVQIAYAISGKGLEPVTVTRGYLYSVRVRFAARDPSGRVVASMDTTRHFVAPEPVPDGEHLVGRVAVACRRDSSNTGWPSSRARSRASCFRETRVRVGGPTSTGLALSDLVLGSRGTNLMWRRSAGGHGPVQPAETFKRSEEMQLYYEVRACAGPPIRSAAGGEEAGRGWRAVPEDLRRRRRGDEPQVRCAQGAARVGPPGSAAGAVQARRLRAGGDGGHDQGRKDQRFRPFQVVEE